MDFEPENRAELQALRQQHIGRLLQQAYRAYNDQAITKLRERGHTGLTLAHTLLLSNLDLDGTRITTLAERAGITKQSMGQLAEDLEKRGYIARQVDPTDRRATVVRFTQAGWQFLQDAYELKQEIEAEYQAVLGTDEFAQLRGALQQLLAHTAPDGEGGAGG
jgi:DNA-binding MarR family transcriptional regulator